MKAVGQFITGAIHDIHVQVPLLAVDGDNVADRVEAVGKRADNGQPIEWIENHTSTASPVAASPSCGHQADPRSIDLMPAARTSRGPSDR
jgi:hypothetical protein